jgi:hypothetical protein
MSIGTYTCKIKLSSLKLTKLPMIGTTYFLRHLKLRASMIKTLTGYRVRDIAQEEKSITGDAQTILNVGTNVLTKSVKSFMAPRAPLTSILRLSTTVGTRLTEKRLQNLLYLPRQMEST